MAHEQGTYSSPIDVLQKAANFLGANGWTVDRSEAEGALSWAVTAHKGTSYVQLKAVNGGQSTDANKNGFSSTYYTSTPWYGIALFMGSAAGSGLWRDRKTGAPAGTNTEVFGVGTVMPSGAGLSYDFFTCNSNNDVVLVFEKTKNVFSYVGFGTSVSKIGTFSGGDYFFGINPGYWLANPPTGDYYGYAKTSPCPFSFSTDTPSAFFLIPQDGSGGPVWHCLAGTETADNNYHRTSVNAASTVYGDVDGNGGRDCGTAAPSSYYLTRCAYSSATQQAYNVPIRIFAKRSGGSTYSAFGKFNHIFENRATFKGIAPRSILTDSADSYVVFPCFAIKREL